MVYPNAQSLDNELTQVSYSMSKVSNRPSTRGGAYRLDAELLVVDGSDELVPVNVADVVDVLDCIIIQARNGSGTNRKQEKRADVSITMTTKSHKGVRLGSFGFFFLEEEPGNCNNYLVWR